MRLKRVLGMTRYLFALAAVDRPIGGRNVLIWVIEQLTRRGIAAHPVYPIRRYRYDFATTSAPGLYDTRLRRAFSRDRLDVVRQSLTGFQPGGDVNAPLKLRSGDTVVIPEFRYPEIARLYPEHRLILFAQDVFGFARAHSRDIGSGARMLDRFDNVLTTSRASEAAVRTLSGRDSLRLRLPLPPRRFAAMKKKMIAYMPRKRPQEADLVVTALRQMPEFADWQFVRIAGMSPEALNRTYEEALIFLSFSKEEGFGLPPAEAMSTGCIVVGYTGVGGEEYFDTGTGFPIPDGDIIAFIDRVREVAKRYETEPEPLDRLRQAAADRIVLNYSSEKAEEVLDVAWDALKSQVKEATTK